VLEDKVMGDPDYIAIVMTGFANRRSEEGEVMTRQSFQFL